MAIARNMPARSLPHDEKRRLIFEAARAVIIDRGYDGATMEEIASRAGVGKGTLYNFFASKEALFLALILDSFERTRDLIDAEVGSVTEPWAQMEAAWRTLMLRVFPDLAHQWNFNYQIWGFIARDHRARQHLFRTWRDMYRDRERQIAASVASGQALGEFRADVDPDTAALLLMSIFDGLLHRTMFDSERVDPESALRGVLALVRSMLSPASSGHPLSS